MPTGYTAGVRDGTVTDFSVFALQCARAFGALVLLRDESMDAPIPKAFEPCGYHADAERMARLECERLKGMSAEDISVEHRAAMDQAIVRSQERDHRDSLVVDRYQTMLAKVRAWTPPTPEHDGLKKFMIEQLEKSIEWDGPMEPRYGEEIETDTEKWHTQRLRQATKDIGRHKVEYAREVERTNQRNAWVNALRESLELKP